MKPLNIYCAGKIYAGASWRDQFDSREPDYNVDWNYNLWPTKQGTVFGHNYVGPYFINCEHGGTAHGSNTHGAIVDSGHSEDVLQHKRVFDLCLDAIRRCDVLYAWIDEEDCYGTISEIGWAAALGKRILIAGPKQFDDLWFVYEMATQPFQSSRDPLAALKRFVLPIDYRDYIQSDEWKAKAKAAKQRAGNRCQVCNKSAAQITLDAHHRTYERLGRELDTDITVLCRSCHAKFHDKAPQP